MPVITIQESTGRSRDQRRALVARITDAFREAYGLEPSAVTIFFQPYRDDEWGKDGKLHTDRVAAKEPSAAADRVPIGPQKMTSSES
jgi:4-oxalocrotonate tautomerase